MPLARSPDVRTLPKASRQKRTGRRPTGPAEPAPPGAQRLPALGRKLWTVPRAHDGARELPAGTEKPPGGSGVNQRRGLSSSTEEGPRSTVPADLGGSRHLHGTPGARRRRQRAGSGRVDRSRRGPVTHSRAPYPCLERTAVVEPPDAHSVRCRGHRYGVDPGLGAVERWHPRTHRAEAAALDGGSDRLGRERVPRLLGRGVPVPSTTTHAPERRSRR